jgi:hypothetical protein
VLVSDGKLSDSRQALARYRPEPGTEQEMRLWMQLHLGVTVTADDVQVMISITGRLPDGEFRDAIIAMLIRESAVARDSDTFPADLIAAIAQLEAGTRNRPGTGLRIDPSDDAALRGALQKRVPDQAAYQKLLASVQAGTACMADIAAFAGQPYGTVLLHRPAGILPAADLAPGMRAAGEKAAGQAVEAFSVLDHITVLAAGRTAFNQPATYRRLAGQYAVDLPLSAADITALAADAGWQPGGH